jgi:hypothetical protein
MGMRDGNLMGWVLAVIALVILAADGDLGWLAVLVPVSFLLACLMIGSSPEKSASNGKSRKAVG